MKLSSLFPLFSLTTAIDIYTEYDDWVDAMEAEGFTVVYNDLSTLLSGQSDDYIELPTGSTDVGYFDITISDDDLSSEITTHKDAIQIEARYSSEDALAFENFAEGQACGFAGTWEEKGDIVLKLDNKDEDEVTIGDYSRILSGSKTQFIGFVVSEGFGKIQFMEPSWGKVEFELKDIYLSVDCGSSAPSVTPSNAPTTSKAPSLSPTVSATPTVSVLPSSTPTLSSSPSSSKSPSSFPSAAPSTSTPPTAIPDSSDSSDRSSSDSWDWSRSDSSDKPGPCREGIIGKFLRVASHV